MFDDGFLFVYGRRSRGRIGIHKAVFAWIVGDGRILAEGTGSNSRFAFDYRSRNACWGRGGRKAGRLLGQLLQRRQGFRSCTFALEILHHGRREPFRHPDAGQIGSNLLVRDVVFQGRLDKAVQFFDGQRLLSKSGENQYAGQDRAAEKSDSHISIVASIRDKVSRDVCFPGPNRLRAVSDRIRPASKGACD